MVFLETLDVTFQLISKIRSHLLQYPRNCNLFDFWPIKIEFTYIEHIIYLMVFFKRILICIIDKPGSVVEAIPVL